MNLFQLLRNNKPLPEVLTADSLARQATGESPNQLDSVAIKRARMAEKLEIIKAEMGEKYILHPKHKVKKLAEPKGY